MPGLPVYPPPTSRGSPSLKATPPAVLTAERPRNFGEWLAALPALIAVFFWQYPGWLLSIAVHSLLLGSLAIVVAHARPESSGLTMEVVPADAIVEQDLDNVVDTPLLEVVGTPDAGGGGSPLESIARNALEAGGGGAETPSLSSAFGLGGSGSGGGEGDGEGTGRGSGRGAGFMGAKAAGRTFVYVVDMSGSMAGERFRRALSELMKSINKLSPEQSFYVYFFNDNTYPMFDKQADKLVAATSTNKGRANRWIRTRQPFSTTNPLYALQQALALKPQVIFLLTDGELDDPYQVRKMIRDNNKSNTQIHTIAFGEDGAQTLETIAAENGGTFTLAK